MLILNDCNLSLNFFDFFLQLVDLLLVSLILILHRLERLINGLVLRHHHIVNEVHVDLYQILIFGQLSHDLQ